MDARGIPTPVCPECGCDLLRVVMSFDPDTYEPALWLLDNAECYECGTLLTAPCPVDHPDYEPDLA